jgi:hypothetical protein
MSITLFMVGNEMFKKLGLGMFIILILGIMPLGMASAVTQTITLNPSTGISTTIMGSGFTPFGTVKVFWNDSTTQMITVPYYFVVGGLGNFACIVTALNQTHSGNYTIYVEDVSTTNTVSAKFIIPILKGATGDTGGIGPTGKIGSVWYCDSTLPDDLKGVNGDFYLCNTNSTVYEKTLGHWTFVANITGLRGIQGLTGDKGDTGSAGATGATGSQGPIGPAGPMGPVSVLGISGTMWYTGTTLPNSTTLGFDGDLYIRTTTYDVFEKVSGTWTIIMNIKGATGSRGNTGSQGSNGSTGATGAIGPIGPKGNTGETGSAGVAGLQGIQGIQGLIGATGPQGKDGDVGATGMNGKDVDPNLLYGSLILGVASLIGVYMVYRKQREY